MRMGVHIYCREIRNLQQASQLENKNVHYMMARPELQQLISLNKALRHKKDERRVN